MKEIDVNVCANCIGLDQTPRCAASDLGLHCLPFFSFSGKLRTNSFFLLIICMSSFLVLGVLDGCFYFNCFLYRNSRKQTVLPLTFCGL